MRAAAIDTPQTVPRWLTALRYGVASVVGVLFVALPVLPGLDPFASAVWLPGAMIYALVVGWPTAMVLHATGRRGIAAALVAGVVAAVFPLGLVALMQPLILPVLAVMGAIAAAIAWLIYRLQTLPDRWLGRTQAALVGLVSLAALTAGAFAATSLTVKAIAGPTDTTCHNAMRDGRRSIGPVASASLDIPDAEWPRLRALLAEQARVGSWSIRDYSHSSEDVRRVALSLCREPGTKVSVDKLVFPAHALPADLDDINIAAYQPQGGDGWIPLVRGVYREISATWPGKLTFKDSAGRVVGAPEWYCAADGARADAVLCRSGHTSGVSAASVNPVP